MDMKNSRTKTDPGVFKKCCCICSRGSLHASKDCVQKAMSQKTMPQKTIPQKAMPQKTMPQKAMPLKAMSQKICLVRSCVIKTHLNKPMRLSCQKGRKRQGVNTLMPRAVTGNGRKAADYSAAGTYSPFSMIIALGALVTSPFSFQVISEPVRPLKVIVVNCSTIFVQISSLLMSEVIPAASQA